MQDWKVEMRAQLASVENEGVDSRGGKCRSGKAGADFRVGKCRSKPYGTSAR